MKFTQLGNPDQAREGPHPFSLRLSEIRRAHFGQRGRSSFARELGIPVTSYIHYETDRVPPAELMVRAAQLTGTRLEWLMCGTGPRLVEFNSEQPSPAGQVCEELRELLETSPDLIPTAVELVQILSQKRDGQVLVKEGNLEKIDSLRLQSEPAGYAGLIPVVGSTAAGIARFWHELTEQAPHIANTSNTEPGAAADARLEELLDVHARRDLTGQGEAVSVASCAAESVALVQYSRPDEQGILEFLDAAGMKFRYPDAVAWRIDGESMSPRYRDGDFVITSPRHPAVEMQPCVARQQGQIGVNCKLFQTQGDRILLIPVHEASRIQELPREQLLWAWRVLASVRLQRAGRHREPSI